MSMRAWFLCTAAGFAVGPSLVRHGWWREADTASADVFPRRRGKFPRNSDMLPLPWCTAYAGRLRDDYSSGVVIASIFELHSDQYGVPIQKRVAFFLVSSAVPWGFPVLPLQSGKHT